CFLFFTSRRRHTRLVSDWSSAVCSSDLLLQRARLCAGSIFVRGGEQVKKEDKERAVADLTERLKNTETLLVADYRGLTMPQIDEIGRASCRERGESSGGGGAVEKKKRKE